MRTEIIRVTADSINAGISSPTSKSFDVFGTLGDIPLAESRLLSASVGNITENFSFYISKIGLNTILSGAEALSFCFCHSVIGTRKRVFLRIVKIIRGGSTGFFMGNITAGSRDIFYTKFNAPFVGSATITNAGNFANGRHQEFLRIFQNTTPTIFFNTGWLLYKKDFDKLITANPTYAGLNFRIGVTGDIIQLFIEVYDNSRTLLSTYSTANAAVGADPTICPPVKVCP